MYILSVVLADGLDRAEGLGEALGICPLRSPFHTPFPWQQAAWVLCREAKEPKLMGLKGVLSGSWVGWMVGCCETHVLYAGGMCAFRLMRCAALATSEGIRKERKELPIVHQKSSDQIHTPLVHRSPRRSDWRGSMPAVRISALSSGERLRCRSTQQLQLRAENKKRACTAKGVCTCLYKPSYARISVSP